MVVALVSCRNGPCRGYLLIYRSLFYIVWFLWCQPVANHRMVASSLFTFNAATGIDGVLHQASIWSEMIFASRTITSLQKVLSAWRMYHKLLASTLLTALLSWAACLSRGFFFFPDLVLFLNFFFLFLSIKQKLQRNEETLTGKIQEPSIKYCESGIQLIYRLQSGIQIKSAGNKIWDEILSQHCPYQWQYANLNFPQLVKFLLLNLQYCNSYSGKATIEEF
jgi:hypothetical protein